MTYPEQASENKDPKFALFYNPENVVHFAPETIAGPVVGFVKADSEELLITLEGHFVYDQQDGAVDAHRERVALLYTQSEWEAFIGGVSDGEFDDMLDERMLLKIRDSKDPEGTILIFRMDAIEPFFLAIREGKYDIPSAAQIQQLRSNLPGQIEGPATDE